MVADNGALVLSSDAIVTFVDGLPRTSTGALKAQTDTTPVATDPFVGGIRVGPAGGVYTTLTAPPTGDIPTNTVSPHVTGDAIVGSTLTCTSGTWTGTATITYAYKWFQRGTPIVGAISSTYVVQAGDLGHILTCHVTATNAVGANTAVSNGVPIVSARYDYKTVGAVPATGNITSTGVQVRINNIDKDGVDHNTALSNIGVGDSIFVGAQEGVIAIHPIYTSGYWIFDMVSWPALADGEYAVKLGYNT
jgi:hypothetical protein